MFANIAVGLVIVALVVFAIRSLVKDHKGGNSCGYGCKGCSQGCSHQDAYGGAEKH